MKKLLDPTEKNIFLSIKKDTLQRSRDVKDFILLLERIDYNAFIAIDGDWGDGKTFFIKEIEFTLRYYRRKKLNMAVSKEENDAFSHNSILGNIDDLEVRSTYLPLYFNAWLYDNHGDPLAALLLSLTKQIEKDVNTTLASSIIDKIASVMDSLQFWESKNWTNLIKTMKGKNILENAILLEDIKALTSDIFQEILAEEGKRMVVFIDELDRCKPTFAVELLERIKHYFDNNQIVFVISINKHELIQTIRKYYGDSFNANRYLNKFFDLQFQLPVGNIARHLESIELTKHRDDDIMIDISNSLQMSYHLSLRDTILYFDKVQVIASKLEREKIESGVKRLLNIMIPIICIFDINDNEKKQQILDGTGVEIVKAVVSNNEVIQKYLLELKEENKLTPINVQGILREVENAYKVAFGQNRYGQYFQGRLFEVDASFVKFCIRVCNGM